MFWKFNLLTSSHIDTLLEKEDVTLHELMDEDDILQECKAQNRKLIDFIIRPEHMEEMVNMITVEPSEDVEEKVKYKYPNTSCELLTSDVSQINDALAGSEALIHKLYAFLETNEVLNPLLASFFSKVMGLLITRKSEMIFEFLKSREDFIGTLLKHIGTSAIMDLLLRLLTCVESPEIRRAVIEWLNENQIVEKLVGCFKTSTDEDVHCNAAQSLCDIVRLGREQLSQLQDKPEPDPLLNTVEMEETVSDLLSNMLDTERNESVIVNGLSVIQTLLEFRKQGPEGSTEHISTLDTERLAQGVSNVLLAITPRLRDFHNLLLTPPKQKFCTMPTSIGTLEPPLGNTRLQIARLVSALTLTNSHSVTVELANLGTMGVLVDLYFKYCWNNFLHTHVSQCINTVLYNSPIETEGKKEHLLLVQLFSEFHLVQRIMDVWEENDQQQSREKGRRRGYMGHLTKIANDVVAVLEKGENTDLLKEQINELEEEHREKWEAFVSGSLSELNKKNTIELVRGHPIASSSDDEDPDFRDIPFPQDEAIQQAFSDYQLQQMTSNFIDQFGFNEEEFTEQEGKLDSLFTERISSIDFNIQANEDHAASSSMFDQACNEKIQQFDDNEDSDEDIWEEKEITYSPSSQAKRRLTETSGDDSDTSTDSEEELTSPKRILQQPSENMDVDSSQDAWQANFDEESTPIAMDTSPWNTATQQPQQQEQPNQTEGENWAEFTNKIPVSQNEDNWADFSNIDDLSSSAPGPRSSSPVEMDTTDVNSRPAAYLARSAPADLGSSIEQVSNDIKTEDLEVESSEEHVQGSEVTSTSDIVTSPRAPTTPRSPPSSSSDAIPQSSSQETTTVGGKSEEPSSSTTDVASDSGAVEADVSQTKKETNGSGGNKQEETPSSSTEEAVGADSPSVLTSAGCVKDTSQKAMGTADHIGTNGPVNVPQCIEEHASLSQEQVENSNQAKDCLEKKDCALPSASPATNVVQNGPV
ncbi:serine/threonine-protein phosphatase 6 regulatory subunit 3-like isoform X2 [Mizuhopecten yessoensis]|uniref:serine/threonine-protein phosphatase 6 regulatory subunit 3-like isoform X2 n=1 Tax=Mizuhopecten yessoensis TaxID=6573 RepID=UPI000B45EBDA|nr:serine/threonine-protein phosphatase 6 regulatory subunit 3-like isoform X2 [Mizuhopecten yessoensis]